MPKFLRINDRVVNMEAVRKVMVWEAGKAVDPYKYVAPEEESPLLTETLVELYFDQEDGLNFKGEEADLLLDYLAEDPEYRNLTPRGDEVDWQEYLSRGGTLPRSIFREKKSMLERYIQQQENLASRGREVPAYLIDATSDLEMELLY